jgi:nucleoside-diphosphate-sugar epimerase
MRALVTGAAGFIGSHLAERLCADDHEVLALDAFTDYYRPAQKRANAVSLERLERCSLLEIDLRDADLVSLLEGVDVVFHLSGQPGVRASWDEGFAGYVEQNVLVTQRMLEAARHHRLDRFVFASSSSVYGNAASYPVSESDLPRPQSPYGVTKLAAEHLCGVYARTWSVPTISLRYFTVYGPRQRPDMAMHRLIEAALTREPFPMYGDGSQVRDFTFVKDVVEANLLAARSDAPPGTVVNISGGSTTTLADVISLIGELDGRPIPLARQEAQPGDVERTDGRIEAAASLLGWSPRTPLREGLAEQLAWHRGRREVHKAAVASNV